MIIVIITIVAVASHSMGGHGDGFQRDAAIDKWGAMRENTWRHFRYGAIVLVVLVLVLVVVCSSACCRSTIYSRNSSCGGGGGGRVGSNCGGSNSRSSQMKVNNKQTENHCMSTLPHEACLAWC
jgi:hypothetical protein